MSLEFSHEPMDAPVISPNYEPSDAAEIGLRPKLLEDYTGQERPRAIFPSILKLPDAGASLWITPCSTALPAWAKPPWPASLPMRWA